MSANLSKIESFEVTVPLPKPLPLGAMFIDSRQYTLVRIHDDDGNVGTSYGLSRNVPISAVISRLIAPRWEKQPLENHPAFYESAVRGNFFLGSNGIFWRALSLADCALYDLLARRDGKPLGEYLGGVLKTTPTTLAGCYPTADETPDSLRTLMENMANRNPAGIKVTSSTDYARDTQRLAMCRKAIPDGPPLINDLYCMAGDPNEVLKEARQWEAFNMLWLEDPYPFDDLESVATLADGLSYRVGVGDEQSGKQHFKRLIEQGHVRVLRLDATVCGGVRAFIEIAAMAAQHDVPVSSHVFHYLHSQLASAVPNVKWIEYMLPETGVESIHLLWNSDLKWGDGGLIPSSVPGVGTDWNDDAIAYYRARTAS